MAGLLDFIRRFFTKEGKLEKNKKLTEDEVKAEPKYWPEVRDFIHRLNQTIETHTISDSNVQHINQRIVDYVEYQINVKGQIENIEERYNGLDTLADRILSNTFSKIVGLKHSESTHADFTEIVEDFKQRLHKRHQEELELKQHKVT